jgi:hypothetical protein
MGGFTFDDEEDEGIFGDSENLAAGDPVAKADIEAQNEVPMLSMGRDDEGFASLLDEDRSILDAPERVDTTNFICLGGPCRHYTENARLVPEGPGLDADENIETGRWCDRVRTWAEQLDLTEARIYACTAFEPIAFGDPDSTRAALEQNTKVLASIQAQRHVEQADIGLCCRGPCREFVEMLVQTPTSDDRESRRWCVKLAGAGRLYDLRERPVVACTGWMPRGSSPELAEVARSNIARIAQCRKVMAERPKTTEQEQEENAD